MDPFKRFELIIQFIITSFTTKVRNWFADNINLVLLVFNKNEFQFNHRFMITSIH